MVVDLDIGVFSRFDVNDLITDWALRNHFLDCLERVQKGYAHQWLLSICGLRIFYGRHRILACTCRMRRARSPISCNHRKNNADQCLSRVPCKQIICHSRVQFNMGNQQQGNARAPAPPTKADLTNTRKSILDFTELNTDGELV
jgi:hypothetical protein